MFLEKNLFAKKSILSEISNDYLKIRELLTIKGLTIKGSCRILWKKSSNWNFLSDDLNFLFSYI
jgi:hypothetical protein